MGEPKPAKQKSAHASGGRRAGRHKLRVLFTCIGRRVSLLNYFRRAARRLRIDAEFCGTDITELSAALQLCDRRFIVHPVHHRLYISDLLKIVDSHGIDLVIPTIDTDLLPLARNKKRFEKLRCRVLVSEPDVIEICQDKTKTYKFLTRHRFETPWTVGAGAALSGGKLGWPCFVKPRYGSASKGNAVVRNRKELAFYARKIPNALCQEFVEGTEYTCDVYVDFKMNVRCVVPRKRIEVRAGEVSKGQVVMHRDISAEAGRLVEQLGAGPGVVTIQLFLTRHDEVKFIEINPRFGGGVPLSIEAGADFPKWILQETTGRALRTRRLAYGLTMLRYDAEVWLPNT